MAVTEAVGFIETGILLLAGVLALSFVLRKPPPPSGSPARLSLLGAWGFFWALIALAAALAAVLCSEFAAPVDLLGLHEYDLRALRLVAEILRYCALVPALAALAFAMAGRGAIRESQGALRGMALCRAAILLSLVVGGLSWAGIA